MPGPYSQDLRDRVASAIAGGSSACAAARRFRISESTAVRWAQRMNAEGHAEARAMEGDRRSRLTGHRATVLTLIAHQPDLTLAEIRADVAEARHAFIRRQPALDPERLVFLDETAAATNMTRPFGRCARGLRLIAPVPHGHRKTTTLVAGLRTTGITAPYVLEGAMPSS